MVSERISKFQAYSALRKSRITRERAEVLLGYLSSPWSWDPSHLHLEDQWARPRDLMKLRFPDNPRFKKPGAPAFDHEPQLFRMLDTLIETGLVERRPDGAPTGKEREHIRQGAYYRGLARFPLHILLPREELDEAYEKASRRCRYYRTERNAALKILREHGIEEPKKEIKNKIAEVKARIQDLLHRAAARRGDPDFGVDEDTIYQEGYEILLPSE